MTAYPLIGSQGHTLPGCPRIQNPEISAQTLLNTKESIGNLRGKFFEYQNTKFLATNHPAYLLRNPGDKKKVWADIKKVRDFLQE